MSFKDSDRQQEVKANGTPNRVPTGDFDALVSLAANLSGVPFGLVSIQDGGQHEIRSSVGLNDTGILSLEYFEEFFKLSSAKFFIISDIKNDPRFNSNARGKGGIELRFFAGFP